MRTYAKKKECVNAPAGPFRMFSLCVYGYNIRNELISAAKSVGLAPLIGHRFATRLRRGGYVPSAPQSETQKTYPKSNVYAIRGFRLTTKCTIDFRPICSNYKCCGVVASGTCHFDFSDEFVFRDKGSFAMGIVDEKTVKMCAERFNWGVGTVYTTAKQFDWKGDSIIECPEQRLRPGWLVRILE